MFRLDGHIVLLTGAAGHLGTSMALGLAEAGAETILVGRSADALEQLSSRIKSNHKVAAHPVVADCASQDDLTRLVERVEDRFGRLHGLVNNAYGGRVGPILEIGAADFESAARLNLIAPFFLAQRSAALLRAGSEGRGGASAIVNIASMYGKISPNPAVYGSSGVDNPAHYGATKAGLLQLTRYLACNLDPAVIRVNSLSPGPFPNLANAPEESFLNELRQRVPMGRLGEAKEIAGPLVFLLSDCASYINGADVAVDGGWTAW